VVVFVDVFVWFQNYAHKFVRRITAACFVSTFSDHQVLSPHTAGGCAGIGRHGPSGLCIRERGL
jgi:hypothetical protein